MSDNMFKMFSQNLFSDHEKDILEILRECYRNRRHGVSLSDLEMPPFGNWRPIPDIRKFLSNISFRCTNDRLTHEQIEWLTGGWFEEYLYYMAEKYMKPDDILIGVHISRKGVKRNNELDAVFMKDNRLFVIECKTGVETERMFNEIVYKACALREALLGVSCYSYIASLKPDNKDDLKKIAKNMDIIFWDRTIMTKKLSSAFKEMKKVLE